MLAATCVPLLSSALRVLAGSHSESSGELQLRRFDLGRLADLFVRDPAACGCKDAVKDTQDRQLTVNWPKEFGNVNWPAVTVHALLLDNAGDHRWLIFECKDASVIRYLALSKPKEQTRP